MSKKSKNSLKVAELFAGVGGFRIGLEKAGHETVWANQWEPKTKVQHAYNCYVEHFGDFPDLNTDINKVDKNSIPDHDLLVGGFPCQDYSVATTRAKGIAGIKGVLWWDIYDVVKAKKPSYLLLENVDRLLKSPVSQRGRDFGIIMSCLLNEDYVVEWRVINAADYGFPQKRRRVFIFAAKKGTDWYDAISDSARSNSYFNNNGFFSKEFPILSDNDLMLDLGNISSTTINKDIQAISDDFAYPFWKMGIMVSGDIWTENYKPAKFRKKSLRSILQKNVDEKYFVTDKEVLKKWEYLKGAKKEKRVRKDGSVFHYTEGGIPFPEDLKQPARTIITSEGGQTPSRFKHFILDPYVNEYRTLTPEEVESINGFPKGWTKSIPQNWRYFAMGNALVVGLIEKMGNQLKNGPG